MRSILGLALLGVVCACSAQATSPDPAPPLVVAPEPEPEVEPEPALPVVLPAPGDASKMWMYDQAPDSTFDLWGETDPELQAQVELVVQNAPVFRRALAQQRMSLVVVDITDPHNPKYASIRPDWEIFTASLSKIAIMLGVVHEARKTNNPQLLVETKGQLDEMIKMSSNKDAIRLFHKVGFETIREAIYKHKLYDDETGGLWWTTLGTKKLSPHGHHNIAGTARQVARYFLLMEQGKLEQPEDSRFIKDVLHSASLAIFSKGIQRAYPEVHYYGKPGIYGRTVAEGLYIEGPRTRYIVAILTEGLDWKDPAIPAFGRSMHETMLQRHPALPVPADEQGRPAQPVSAPL